MSTTRLTLPRGDTGLWEFTVTQPDGTTPQPITGCTITFSAKRRSSDADADAVVSKSTPSDVEIVDGPGGIVRVHLVPGDTEDLDAPMTLLWDLQIVDGLGNVWTVPSEGHGELRIVRDITRATS
jgi:hypothetical protein